jgi:hypothetical protein
VKRVLSICLLVIGSLFVSPVVSGAKSAELTKAQAEAVLKNNIAPYANALLTFSRQMKSVGANTTINAVVGYCKPLIKASNTFASFLSKTVWPRSLAPSFSNLTQAVSAVSSDLESFSFDPANGTSYFSQALKDINAEDNYVNELLAALKR